MIAYTVNSKDIDKADLPSIVKATLKAYDGFKNKYIISCECQIVKADELMKVTYASDNWDVFEAVVTLGGAKNE